MKIDKKVIISALTLTLLAESGYCAVKQVKKTTQKTKPVKQKVITAKVAQNYSQIDQMIDYGEFSKADKMLSDIIKKNPFDMEARSLQVVSEAKQGKLDTAQEKLNSYLPKMSNNANLHYAQGIINLKRQASSDLDYRNNSEELIKNAVKEFQTAVKLNPKHYPAYNALGVTALNIGNFSKAKEFFSEALEINPNYATAIDNLGTLDYLEENYDAAKTNTIYQRSTAICLMHKARVRANNYYWNKLYRKLELEGMREEIEKNKKDVKSGLSVIILVGNILLLCKLEHSLKRFLC